MCKLIQYYALILSSDFLRALSKSHHVCSGTIGGHTTTVGPSSAGLISNNDSSASNSTEITTLSAATEGGAPNIGVIIGAILGSLAGVVCLIIKDELAGKETMTKTMNRQSCISSFEELFQASEKKKMDPWDEANLLQNMKNEGVHVTTVANQRYVYRGFNSLYPKLPDTDRFSKPD